MRILPSPLRCILRIGIPLLACPLTLLFAVSQWQADRYAVSILLMTGLALLLFLAGIEQRSIGTRRMILASIFIALAIIGRCLPIVKPVTALIILAGMYLGAQSGFLVGAMTALLSNFLYGQGPWTPFQMFAWGILGLLAGICANPLRQSRLLLYGYGLLSGILFSMMMDVWTVLWQFGTLSPDAYRAALLTALPWTLVYALSNFGFLLLLANPIGNKLARIEKKYGL